MQNICLIEILQETHAKHNTQAERRTLLHTTCRLRGELSFTQDAG